MTGSPEGRWPEHGRAGRDRTHRGDGGEPRQPFRDHGHRPVYAVGPAGRARRCRNRRSRSKAATVRGRLRPKQGAAAARARTLPSPTACPRSLRNWPWTARWPRGRPAPGVTLTARLRRPLDLAVGLHRRVAPRHRRRQGGGGPHHRHPDAAHPPPRTMVAPTSSSPRPKNGTGCAIGILTGFPVIRQVSDRLGSLPHSEWSPQQVPG